MPVVPKDKLPQDLLDWAKEMDEIMEVAVANAIEENRRLGLYPESSEDSPAPVARVAEDSEESK